ncbi:endonuclease domain-containing protein [Minwuia sp.]|uniref:endonuclease domain-containing protein n=1 Tax=Minwuia sp. TaxID=2493630 RepID=UPI003A8D53A2
MRRQPFTLARARHLRSEMTRAERLLWSRLRRGQIDGFHFRRQYPVGPFIGDFCCAEKRLIVELDGSQHGLTEREDRRRTEWLEKQGYRVIRFPNFEVFRNLEGVLLTIQDVLLSMPSVRRGPAQ